MGIAQKVKYFKEEVFTSSTMSAKELWGYTAGIAGNTMGQDSTTTLSDVFERDFMGIENTQLQIKENVRNIFGFFFSADRRRMVRLRLSRQEKPFAESAEHYADPVCAFFADAVYRTVKQCDDELRLGFCCGHGLFIGRYVLRYRHGRARLKALREPEGQKKLFYTVLSCRFGRLHSARLADADHRR